MLKIFCKENLNLKGKIYYRESVRGIFKKNEDILLIFSKENGDYKLPGGGIEKGETYNQALIRECLEEAGINIQVKNELLRVMEYDEGQHNDYDIFKMLSIYYICEIKTEKKLIEFEQGTIPQWININQAIEINKNIMKNHIFPKWTKRETIILEYLKENFWNES